jgi:hypothetical protein
MHSKSYVSRKARAASRMEGVLEKFYPIKKQTTVVKTVDI